MPIQIFIADDHALLRQGIKKVLLFEDDLEVVGEAGDGQETLAKTIVMQPNVLLLDLNMPGLNGIEVIKELKKAKCHTKIIALTIHDNDAYVIEVLKNGALGYLLKDVEPDVLIRAIHTVNRGNAFVYPQLAERIFGQPGTMGNMTDVQSKAKEIWSESHNFRLTGREMEVISCIAQGFTNMDIAKALCVSEKTVKNHLTNIFRKLNVTDRTQALVYVLKNKIITLE